TLPFIFTLFPTRRSSDLRRVRDVMRKRRVMQLSAVFLAAGSLWCLCGQTLDTGILGTVTDPTGAVIAGAVVNITHTATGVQRTTDRKSTRLNSSHLGISY